VPLTETSFMPLVLAVFDGLGVNIVIIGFAFRYSASATMASRTSKVRQANATARANQAITAAPVR
jgi:hypothetical protein